MAQDSLNTVTNTTQVYSPLFVYPKSDSLHIDSTNIDFSTYVVRTLNENLPPIKKRKSLFREKSYTSKNLDLQKRENHTKNFDWVLALIILIASVYIILIKAYPKRLKQILLGCFSNRAMNNMLREGNLISEIILLPVIFIFIPCIALLAFGVINEYDLYEYIPIKSHIGIFGVACGIAIVFYSLKLLLINFFGTIFKCEEVTSQYNNNQIAYYALYGLISAPFLFFYFYSPKEAQEGLLLLICCILGILYIIRFIRGFFIVLSSSKFSRVYLFFYLCTIELIPLLIVYKLLA